MNHVASSGYLLLSLISLFQCLGGETIKTINQQTGAHCELDRRPPVDPSEKTFILRGSPDQIDHAKKLIAEKSGIVSSHWLMDVIFFSVLGSVFENGGTANNQSSKMSFTMEVNLETFNWVTKSVLKNDSREATLFRILARSLLGKWSWYGDCFR